MPSRQEMGSRLRGSTRAMLCRYAGLARRRAGCNRWAMTSPIRRYAPEAFPILGFLTALVSFAIPLNPFLVGLILAGAVVAAVHHAEVIAHRVGEPLDRKSTRLNSSH